MDSSGAPHKRRAKPCGSREAHARRAPHLRREAHPSAPASAQSGRSSGVEHNLAKVGVEGSNPFARSSFANCQGQFRSWSARATRGATASHCSSPSVSSELSRSSWYARPPSLCGPGKESHMAEQAELTRPKTSKRIETINPATGETGKKLRGNLTRRSPKGGRGCARRFPRVAPDQLRRAAARSSIRPPRSSAGARRSSLG